MAVVGIVAAALMYRFVYNKPHPDFEKARPEHMVAASELFDSYRNDRLAAEERYNGRIVLISGRLDTIESAEAMVTAVFVLDQGMFGDEGIRCVMLPGHEKKLLPHMIGSPVRLKGYVTGYNDADVILEHCSVVL